MYGACRGFEVLSRLPNRREDVGGWSIVAKVNGGCSDGVLLVAQGGEGWPVVVLAERMRKI